MPSSTGPGFHTFGPSSSPWLSLPRSEFSGRSLSSFLPEAIFMVVAYCRGADFFLNERGWMAASDTSRHFAAMQHLVAIGQSARRVSRTNEYAPNPVRRWNAFLALRLPD